MPRRCVDICRQAQVVLITIRSYVLNDHRLIAQALRRRARSVSDRPELVASEQDDGLRLDLEDQRGTCVRLALDVRRGEVVVTANSAARRR